MLPGGTGHCQASARAEGLCSPRRMGEGLQKNGNWDCFMGSCTNGSGEVPLAIGRWET